MAKVKKVEGPVLPTEILEIDGKKYQFAIALFYVPGKGEPVKASDLIANQDEETIKWLIDVKSAVLVEVPTEEEEKEE
jgi:hypothetical protein